MVNSLSLLLPILLFPTIAAAQDEPADPPRDEAPTASGAAASEDGPRRRRYTALNAGLEQVSDSFGNTLTATMGGVDVHFGTQINDTFAVYVPLHLSFGVFPGLGSVAGIPGGLTGTLAATVVVDATVADRFFVGGGAGIGVLNNPTGPAVHLRAGGYPLVTRAADGRRKGLTVALDLRLVYPKGFKASYPSLSVGYASF